MAFCGDSSDTENDIERLFIQVERFNGDFRHDRIEGEKSIIICYQLLGSEKKITEEQKKRFPHQCTLTFRE